MEPELSDYDTATEIRKWCESAHGPFSWPTDGCGYEQHIRFVRHRNKEWKGGNHTDFIKFVREYADMLDGCGAK